MKRALGLGVLIAALSVINLAQAGSKAGNKGQPEEQTTPPTATINPSTIDFKDQVTKKASKPQRIVVTNTGGKELYINSVVLEGDNKEDFTLRNDTCTGATVAAGKSCVIDVIFTPGATERRKAVVAITDSAVDSPQKVAMTGNGINSVAVPPRQSGNDE